MRPRPPFDKNSTRLSDRFNQFTQRPVTEVHLGGFRKVVSALRPVGKIIKTVGRCAQRGVAIACFASLLLLVHDAAIQNMHYGQQDDWRYERGEALKQKDVAAVSQITWKLREDPFYVNARDQWKNLDNEQRLTVLTQLHHDFMDFYDDADPVKIILERGLSSYGSLRPFENPEAQKAADVLQITLNPFLGKWNNFKAIVGTLIHESTHAVQFQHVLTSMVTGQIIGFDGDTQKFKQALADYPGSFRQQIQPRFYYKNILEQHAFSNGDCAERALKIPQETYTKMNVPQPVTAYVKACFGQHRTMGRYQITAEHVQEAARKLEQSAPKKPNPPKPVSNPAPNTAGF